MATYNGNNVYLEWDGVDISAYWTSDVDFSESVDTVDTTAGAGQAHRQRAVGLADTSISLTVIYDDVDLSSYVGKLVPGTVGTLTYGPEGSGSGKPKFEGSMILQQVSGPNPGIEKPMVMFELTFEAADAPTATVSGGDTFA